MTPLAKQRREVIVWGFMARPGMALWAAERVGRQCRRKKPKDEIEFIDSAEKKESCLAGLCAG